MAEATGGQVSARLRNVRKWIVATTASLALFGVGTTVAARGGPGGRGHHDGAHHADMRGIHALFANRAAIRRTVTLRADGVETLTESDDPVVAAQIQAHVAAMTRRLDEGRPIHARDPLFRAIFAHADEIEIAREHTAHGIRVVETSSNPYAVRLVQAHAVVVSAFLANGHAEMHRDHAVPEP